jgi:hypothetical protein
VSGDSGARIALEPIVRAIGEADQIPTTGIRFDDRQQPSGASGDNDGFRKRERPIEAGCGMPCQCRHIRRTVSRFEPTQEDQYIGIERRGRRNVIAAAARNDRGGLIAHDGQWYQGFGPAGMLATASDVSRCSTYRDISIGTR